ncbi:MAG TPA: glutathione ABC transporter permease GsiD [Peptococcaceae bacterium]|nr:glutathione ABC transporter permease GsiD [Peptococcaceae bacterium]
MVPKKFSTFSLRTANSRITALSALIILLLVFTAIAAPVIAPHDPVAVDLANKLKAPSLNYPFGTDHLGRCIFSRVIYGTRESLKVSLIVVSISASIGILLGLVSGYFGGLTDELIMRAVDIMLAFPSIILALAIITALGPGLNNVILALTLVHWTSYARLVRGEVLRIKEKEFVESARAMGNSQLRIMFRYILPNVMAPVMVVSTLDVAHVILSASGLSFLGLGAQPPTPEWGAMVNDGREFIRTAPHLTIFPGLAIMITSLAFNWLGDWLRDALDPRLREGRIE